MAPGTWPGALGVACVRTSSSGGLGLLLSYLHPPALSTTVSLHAFSACCVLAHVSTVLAPPSSTLSQSLPAFEVSRLVAQAQTFDAAGPCLPMGHLLPSSSRGALLAIYDMCICELLGLSGSRFIPSSRYYRSASARPCLRLHPHPLKTTPKVRPSSIGQLL